MPSTKNSNKIWVSATDLRNYMLRDPLLDWLNINFTEKRFKNNEKRFKMYKSFVKIGKSKKKDYSNVKKKVSNTFHQYLLNQGHTFEEKVVKRIKKKVGSKNFIDLSKNQDPKLKSSFLETVEAMKLEIPIIHGGVLHNELNQTYGITDLIVRSDFFGKLFKINPLKNDEITIPSPNLISLKNNKPLKYHYRIIDIKFSSLSLRADGIHLLNSKHTPAYKAQLWIYNQALSNIQGYNPGKSYILGRKWSFESCKGYYNGHSCFDRLGVIDYEGIDFSYCSKSEKAIEWMRDVKSPESKDWIIDKVPLTRPELYPNMSNLYDEQWREIKYKLSENIKELTSIWMVGTKNREIAHKNGIYKWNDKRCTSKKLGLNGEIVGKVVNEILKTNKGNKKINPSKIKNNVHNWKNKGKIEFFVDFEFIGTMFTDFSNIENDCEQEFVFMIGVGYVNKKEEWIYKDFTCKEKTAEEEIRIFLEFSDYIINISKKYKCKNAKCFHWGNAEKSNWERFFERHKAYDVRKIMLNIQSKFLWEWADLMEVFKTEPITVKNCFNFSLKSIAKAMYSHNMIQTIWDDSCSDGLEVMMICSNSYKLKNSLESSGMKNVILYNNVDCKVLFEILSYLRKNMC